MPAAAVIPAPVAYIKVVAVKKLVVGFLVDNDGPSVPSGSLSIVLICHPLSIVGFGLQF